MENLVLDLENYDLWYQPFWKTNIFYLIILLNFILVGLILFFYFKRTVKQEINPNTIPGILEKLYLMRAGEDFTEDSCKSFYIELTLHLKQFLSLHIGTDFNSKTEQEIVDYLNDNNFSQNFIQTIKDMVLGASGVKFANKKAAILQMNSDIEKIIKLIKESIQSDG